MDDFQALMQGPGPYAQVGMTVGTAQPFGKLKVSAFVLLNCDQNKAALDSAGYKASMQCLELITRGMQMIAPLEGAT